MKTIYLTLLCAITSLVAQNVQITHDGIKLNANYETPSKNKSIFLITHGTLAHNEMEIIATMQELLTDNEANSLAINLSLGINNRSSAMYDCDITHKHTHQDALDEIDAWVAWLKQKGYNEIHLVGHSRGGNQTAWYYSEYADKIIASATLIAPQTWKETKYKHLKQANASVKKGKGKKVFKNIDFIYCEKSAATARAIEGYYKSNSFLDTPTILQNINKPVLVVIGSVDKTVKDLPKKMKKVKNENVSSITVDGADHYFRDLYLEDVVEEMLGFVEEL